MCADLAYVRRVYPHLAFADDRTVSAHAKTVRNIDALMTNTNLVQALLSRLPDGKLKECKVEGRVVISFNFRTEDTLLEWLQAGQASCQVSCMIWPQYDDLGLIEYQHKPTIDRCRADKQMLCILIRTNTTIYCSAAITL